MPLPGIVDLRVIPFAAGERQVATYQDPARCEQSVDVAIDLIVRSEPVKEHEVVAGRQSRENSQEVPLVNADPLVAVGALDLLTGE